MTTPYTPVWLQPNVNGMLSNTRGNNSTVDKIAFKALYSNPAGVGAQPGSLRAYISRLKPGGVQPDIPWDTWWSSIGNIQAPPGLVASFSGNCSAIYNNRIYIYAGNSGFGPISAPLSGPSIGTFRKEAGVNILTILGQPTIAYPESIVILNGVMYATIPSGQVPGTSTKIWFSVIQGDGSLGAWSLLAGSNLPNFTGSAFITGYTDTTGTYILFITPANGTFYNTQNSDGTVGATWTVASNTPASNVLSGAYFCQPSGNNDGIATLYIIGGSTNALPNTPVGTIQKSTLTSGNTGAFTSLATGLPANLANFGFMAVGPDSNNNYLLVVAGGNTTFARNATNGLGEQASGQVNTCYFINASQLGAAWSSAGALATAVDGSMVAITENKPGSAWTIADIFVIGGYTGASFMLTVQHSHWTGVKPVFTIGSTGNNMLATDLGTGASIVVNADGTVSITFLYGALGAGAQLSDGDALTLFLQITDNQGDPSALAIISFQIGQPPSISNVSPGGSLTITTPTFTFNFTIGAGGGPEDSWRLEIIQGPATNILYDTGITKGQGNSQQVVAVPALPNGTYALYIIGYSTDIPYPGSSNQNLFASSIVLNAAAAGQPT